MSQKIKYLELHESLYGKIKFELHQEILKRKIHESQNRKLEAKIESMAGMLDKFKQVTKNRKDRMNCEISF